MGAQPIHSHAEPDRVPRTAEGIAAALEGERGRDGVLPAHRTTGTPRPAQRPVRRVVPNRAPVTRTPRRGT
ncbi:hypothetical protein CGL27_48385 [Streptomyces sp. 11-1-2]|nr:hypothetical protein CGL27_48385 [Streptomyces sp. 11-1-2]